MSKKVDLTGVNPPPALPAATEAWGLQICLKGTRVILINCQAASYLLVRTPAANTVQKRLVLVFSVPAILDLALAFGIIRR